MSYTLEDVKQFIDEFTELEYQFGVGFYDSSITNDEWMSLVQKLENCYGERFVYYAIINTYRDDSRMTEERFNNNKKSLKKRKLFLIRKYENPVFGKGIIDASTDVVYSCFLGSNVDMGVEAYVNNLSVGIVDNKLKIISARRLNDDKGLDEIEWIYNKRSNVYKEAITIKKDGTLVDTLRVFEPEHPTWIADYNS